MVDKHKVMKNAVYAPLDCEYHKENKIPLLCPQSEALSLSRLLIHL